MSKPSEKSSDSAIVECFQQGDTEVFDILVRRYASKAYQIAYGILGSREDAEEVAQDGFIRIFRALHKFRGDSEFTTWMYRIIVNLARNKYRWNKSRGSQRNLSIQATATGDEESTSLEAKLPDKTMRPDQKAELSELEKMVYREMEKLPPLYREALVLRNIQQLSYDEISSILGCKLGTIKSRIARAREELRKRLEV